MRTFEEIHAIAAGRHGGPAALEARLVRPDPEVSALPEDRWLSVMTKCVFQAGFNWQQIEDKWPAFEARFHSFDPDACAFMSEEEFDSLLQDKALVRNGAKLASVRQNAGLIQELRSEGGAGAVLGGWPSEDYAGLLDMLKTRGSRLGGLTGQYAMRFAGRDSFILSQDVTARLIAEGVTEKPATSKSALKAVQAAFNTWRAQSGRSLSEISRVLALSL
ncbi:DNA-3-methyladenine glycosylase I [Cribrihabitans neustonicus]|uniref:DNA-3-methyladenine glycosylase I n=1 Tax=Cribrihabitans neustonicus TaxID=1429085 RepID=UPI003B5CEF66